MLRNKFYIALAIIIIFIFLSSIVTAGCKTEGEKEDTGEEEVQAEESATEEAVASDEGVSEINDISVEEVYEIISTSQDYIILDVRTPEEFNEGHIEGAVLIPVDTLKNRLNELPVDKPIITYCKSGGRSREAAIILVENGFTQVYDMGGILDWQDKGYPVIMNEEVIAEDEGYSEIMPISVDESYDFFGNEDYIFLDVRSIDEYSSVHIEGAINIPVNELEDRLDELLKDKVIIAYCNGSSCNRSKQAANILVMNGFEHVYNMEGRGIFEWEEKGYPVEK